MTQKGEHTWDLAIHYHRCPNCGLIIESRNDFILRNKSWMKDLSCSRCGHMWIERRNLKPRFGLLKGAPQPPEIDWS